MENRINWKLFTIFGALVLVFALGVMVFLPGFAASSGLTLQTEEDDTDEAFPWKGGFGSFRGHGRGFSMGGKLGFGTSFDYDAFMADALGVTVAELQAARQAANTAALEQAIAEGYLTEEQAELIEARQALMEFIDMDELLSTTLGISEGELTAARHEGKSLFSLLDELDLDASYVRDAMDTAYQKAVDQAIEEGVITESQAEKLQKGSFGGRGFGGFGGGFRERGGFFHPELDPDTGNDP